MIFFSHWKKYHESLKVFWYLSHSYSSLTFYIIIPQLSGCVILVFIYIETQLFYLHNKHAMLLPRIVKKSKWDRECPGFWIGPVIQQILFYDSWNLNFLKFPKARSYLYWNTQLVISTFPPQIPVKSTCGYFSRSKESTHSANHFWPSLALSCCSQINLSFVTSSDLMTG